MANDDPLGMPYPSVIVQSILLCLQPHESFSDCLYLLIFLFLNSICYADPNVDEYVRKSYLVISAFDCAIVAPNVKEAERLFTIDLESGREFIEFARGKADVIAKAPWQLALLSGPTTDFILGQLYAMRVAHIHKDFSSNNTFAKMR